MPRPNILILFSDQQRADTCGCYGQTLPVTPELDRLAADGVLFEHAYTCQPVCGPARSCLQTGLWPTETGCVVNDRMLPRDAKTIAHHLGDCGYQTAYIGKWHLASHYHYGKNPAPAGSEKIDCSRSPVPPDLRGGWRDHWLASDILEFTSHGYDGHMFDAAGRKRHFPDGRYRADAQTDWLLEWLSAGRDAQRPFLAMCSWIEPHHQNDHQHYEGPHGSKQRWSDFTPPGDLMDQDGDWRQEYPDYLGCINALDTNIGRIRARLEELGIWDNTLVIYCSDHGSHFRTRNGEYKRSCHDASLRIPLIMHGPGLGSGKHSEAIASLMDIPRTVLAAAGVPAPSGMRGRDLATAVDTPPTDWPQEAYVQISESCCGRAIRTKRWTYAVTAPDATVDAITNPSGTWQETHLYDNDTDPHQLNNLVADPAHAPIRTELRDRLLVCMQQAGEPAGKILAAQAGE
jgi:arylsulfatase A-like enzyme